MTTFSSYGAVAIPQYPEIRTAIIDEAITNGLVPVAHINEEADGRQLIEAGLKDFLHSTVRTFGPGADVPMDDPAPSQEFLQMARDNDIVFSPTLSISQNNWHFAEHPELLDDPELRAAMNPDALASWDDPEVRANVVEDAGFEDRKAAFRQVQAFVKTIHDARISVALGTDSGTRNVPMGWGTHHELELYVEAGLTPMQALVAATATGARAMPPVGESDFGTLEVGKIADLILLDADPLADIRNTLAIDRVMQRGEWVDRDGLLPTPYRSAGADVVNDEVVRRHLPKVESASYNNPLPRHPARPVCDRLPAWPGRHGGSVSSQRRQARPGGGGGCRRGPDGVTLSRSGVAGQRLTFAGSIVVMADGTFWLVQRVVFSGGMARGE